MITDYKYLATNLARISCRINCLYGMSTDPMSRRERVRHNKDVRAATKEQHELIVQTFHQEEEHVSN
jgi:hypothetical protein